VLCGVFADSALPENTELVLRHRPDLQVGHDGDANTPKLGTRSKPRRASTVLADAS
jgi:hypothetical protein